MNKTMIVILIVFLSINYLWAVDEKTAKEAAKDNKISVSGLDFQQPDLSAFTLLGVTPNNISRPADLKEIATAVSSAVDENGKIAPGAAIEWTPLFTFGKDITLADYQNKFKYCNIQLSFATAKINENSKVAFGFRWIPYNEGDPLVESDFQNKIGDILENLYDDSSASQRKKFLDGIKKYLIENFDKEQKKFLMVLENIFEQKDVKDKIDGCKSNDNIDCMNKGIDELKIKKKKDITSIFLQQYKINLDDSVNSTKKEYLFSRIEIWLESYLNRERKLKIAEKELTKLRDEYKQQLWNKLIFQIAGGGVLKSPDALYKNLRIESISSFVGLGIPIFKTLGQLLLQGKYNYSFDKNNKEVHYASLGGRLYLGNEKVKWSLEALYYYQYLQPDKIIVDNKISNDAIIERYKNSKLRRDHNLRFDTGLDVKCSENLWLELVVGTKGPISNFKKSEFIGNIGISYAMLKERSIANIVK